MAQYPLGDLRQATPIAEGVENSNYLLETETGKSILTIFEKRTPVADLPYYLGLMEHLAAQGFDCPKPLHLANGELLCDVVAGKKAAIVSFLEGKAIIPAVASSGQLRQVGAMNARMQQQAKGFEMRRANGLSVAGWRKLYEACAQRADEVVDGLSATIEAELLHLMDCWPIIGLPSGPVHVDLFPDNIFFQGDELSGVIDFYFACNDHWAYDLAITFNAWVFDAQHELDSEKAAALMAGYQSVRPLTDMEKAKFPTLARGAALRFLLTRLHDWLYPVEGALVTAKDPMEYLRKLQFHQSVSAWEDYPWMR